MITKLWKRNGLVAAMTLIAWSQFPAQAQDPCPRFPLGSAVQEPEDLYSQNGVLSVDLSYQTSIDAYGETHYCFVNSDGAESPTLHVNPGDTLVINLTNLVPDTGSKMRDMPEMEFSKAGDGGCAATTMTAASVNIHYHGTNTPPVCHQDEVIHTIINSGQTFRYEVHFPKDEPPGLYWYHPHIHGISTAAVQGGASGAIIVEGIENVNPKVAGLPQQLLIVRDNPAENPGDSGTKRPGKNPNDKDDPPVDLSLNYIPITGPLYSPATMTMRPRETQFWRVLNACAETVIDLQLQYDNKLQPMEVVALDGVPIGSQKGSGKGSTITDYNLLIPPAGRAEFIVKSPGASVQNAVLVAEGVTTGPAGDNDPTRLLLQITPSETAAEPAMRKIPAVSAPPPPERFAGLADAKPTAKRKLYFSEDGTYFYITVDGQTPQPYEMNEPPAIVTTQGSVEDWTIENRALENHEFHIHQIHFLLLARDGKPVSPKEQQFLDTVNLPYWPGTGRYPSVTLRMDFRGPDVGDFVYHCHILDHEDAGMMAIIRVLPRGSSALKNHATKDAAKIAAARNK
ncbi:MAG TPA: multicopper oxidase domain-containing protein [Chthoniobacterales bacterium]|jgi:FtsP/CotA-like multicopper oxidase with cupredoxin domain